MKIVIFGSGYVGLVTAAFFAEQGHSVTAVDIDPAKVSQLQAGHCPIYEPGLQELLVRHLEKKSLRFTLNAPEAVAEADFIFIAVGTPQQSDGQANLEFVESVAKTLGEHIQQDVVIVNKSTVPVETCFRVKQWVDRGLKKRQAHFKIAVVSNPEFLKEGSALADAFYPDRIIIGVNEPWAKERMQKLYQPFEDKLVWMDPVSSEFTKYVANAMLATKISFMNEMSQIAEKIGADIELVKQGISLDPRIGNQFINPGCGYGGSCFPKDVRALMHIAAQAGVNSRLLEAVDRVNQLQKNSLLKKLQDYFPDLSERTIAIWGLSFKPNTDDLREAPSLTLIEGLSELGAHIRVFDPVAGEAFLKLYGSRPKIHLASSKEEAAEGSDALVLVTEWNDFKSASVDFVDLKRRLNRPLIIDGRNLYDPQELRELGFEYEGMGRRNTARVSRTQ